MKRKKRILGIVAAAVSVVAVSAGFTGWYDEDTGEFIASVSQNGNWPNAGFTVVDFGSATLSTLSKYECGTRISPGVSQHEHGTIYNTDFWIISKEWYSADGWTQVWGMLSRVESPNDYGQAHIYN